MAVDYSAKTVAELNTIVANCKRLKKANAPVCLAAEEELNRRQTILLEPAKSRELILASARAGQFLSYGALAAASGVTWSPVVRRQMASHLGALVSHAHDKGWPMISAIVVEKTNVSTGKLEPGALKGFIKVAHDLGRVDIDADGATFLEKERKRLFAYAQDHVDL